MQASPPDLSNGLSLQEHTEQPTNQQRAKNRNQHNQHSILGGEGQKTRDKSETKPMGVDPIHEMIHVTLLLEDANPT